MVFNIVLIEIDVLFVVDEDVVFVLELENFFILVSFKIVLSYFEIVFVFMILKGFWKLSNNCLVLFLIVFVFLMYLVRSVNGYSLVFGIYCLIINGFRCFLGLDVFNKLLK